MRALHNARHNGDYRGRMLHRSALTLLFLALSAMASPSDVWADPDTPESLFRDALICYGEINFPCTLEKLEQAEVVARTADPGHDLRGNILLYKGFALVALGREREAADAFRGALRENPDLTLSSERVSPKILTLFEQVREEIAALRPLPPEPQPQPEPAPEPPPEPEPEPVVVVAPEEAAPPPPTWPEIGWIIGGRIGAAGLVSEDRRDFDPGLAVDFHGAAALGQTWMLGARLSYQRHAGRDGIGELNILGAYFEPSLHFEIGRFWFHLPLDVGIGVWGFDALADEVGLIWRVEPAAYLRVTRAFSAGLWVGPGGVVTGGPAQSSYFISGGAGFLGTF